ncbi:MAG: rhomboid family intramembrane serine protease [Bacteroidetes bacterium]|nr:rhomboid family intramembrane serine protease [Bacteroidota bacterium]MBS1630259.1 rhomboid family intramembrane serine protease [Bacteroidota bacterium]
MSPIAFTITLVLVTVLLSIAAFNDNRLADKLILWPAKMNRPGEYYRLLTSGFIHADWMHLLFNMFTLFFIGRAVEQAFLMYGLTPWLYVLMYLAGIVVASLPSFLRKRNNPYYRSLGASGGVAAVLFSLVYFAPWAELYIYFLPVPNIVFAILYLIYSVYMSKRGNSTINHDAHFWGAIFGFVFTLLIEPSHGANFLQQLLSFRF